MTGTSTRWGNRMAFIFASSAAAIGLGNIWRFPYMTGENGGGAFVLLYLGFVAILGIPLLIAEILIGRIGRANPAQAFCYLAKQAHQHKSWSIVGGLTIAAGFLILTYYVVIVGWVMDYIVRSAIGQFHHISQVESLAAFNMLKDSPWQMLLTDTLVIGLAVTINILGIKRGLERAVMILFPLLLLLLLLLLVFAMNTDGFHESVMYLFAPDIDEVTSSTILHALGQAFFSLNIAMGITIMFSAYLPHNMHLPTAAIAIAISDTLFALLAGLIIFPIVFTYHLTPSAGPSLIFQTLPIAFGKMPLGSIIATAFFIMLFFAAFTSVIALFEPAISWLEETWQLTRPRAVILAAMVCWLISLPIIGSFSNPSYFQFYGFTIFQSIDYLTAAIMLPLGGIFIAIFCGWVLKKHYLKQQLNWIVNGWYHIWQIIMRYVAPLAILFILLTSLKIL